MNDEAFWNLIARSRSTADGNPESQADALREQLARLSPQEIVDFDRLFRGFAAQAFHWNLWGAAYIIGGGCSDDAFTDFRSWLISRGRDVYERAITDADSLATLDPGPDPEEAAFFEEFAYIAAEAYEEAVGDDMPDPSIDQPEEPAGEPWNEEGDDLRRRFPRLWAKYGHE